MTGKEKESKVRKLRLSCGLTSTKKVVKSSMHRQNGLHGLGFKRAYELAFNKGTDHCSTLNGSCGESTNSDDVKGKKGNRKAKAASSSNRLVKKLNKVINSQADQIVSLAKKRVKSGNKMSVPRFLTGRWQSAAEMAYIFALTQPFHPNARGAKCLVYPSKNTATACITWTAYYSPTTNGTAVAVFVPNPTMFGWSAVGTAVTASFATVDGAMSQVSNSASYGMNGALVDSTTSSSPLLSTILSNYRVVGGGVKFRGNQDTAHAQISHWLASMPLENPDFNYENASGANGTAQKYTKHGVASFWENGGSGQSFVEASYFGQVVAANVPISVLPATKRLNNYDIMQSELVGNFKVCGPDAFEFKDLADFPPQLVNDAGGTVYDWDASVTQSISGTNTHNRFRRGATDVAGFEGFYLKTAIPSGSTSTACLAVDYILHVEGIPNVGSIAGPGMGPTSTDPSIYAKAADEVVRLAGSGVNIAIKALTSPTGLNVLKGALGLVNKRNDQFFNRRRIEF